MNTDLALIGLDELSSLVSAMGFPGWRARQVLDWRNRGVLDPAAMNNIPMKLRQALQQHWPEPVIQLRQRQCSEDGTRKYLFSLRGGGQVETVMIPEEKRITICLSSQVGCVLDCPFCNTGLQAFEKNLEAAAIVAQVWMVQQDILQQPVGQSRATRPTHLVYMGMGEPMANEAGLHGSLRFFLAEDGMGLSRRRITVSTSGLIPQIERLGAAWPVNLAISLHSADNELRNTLVPINRKYPLPALRQALDAWPLPAQRHMTLEYVMLAGVNDRPEDAERLIAFVNKGRERVNLIRFNPHPGAGYQGSSRQHMDAFARQLVKAGVRATIRRSRGDDIMAACGQLRAASGQ